MPTRRRRTARLLLLAVVLSAGPIAPAVAEEAEGRARESSQPVTWSCTGAPCPWGESTAGNAATWPEGSGALSQRYGYTTTRPVYLPADVANGLTISLESGSAGIFAGPVDGPHRSLAWLSAGDSLTVTGLPAAEVLSVQNDGGAFTYSYVASDSPTPSPTPEPDPEPAGTASRQVAWDCTGEPCPWGGTTTGNAIAWPENTGATTERHGYTTSQPIYLPADVANGDTITVETGSATLFVGTPTGSHQGIARLTAGQEHTVTGLAPDQVLSVQNDDAAFTYTHTPGDDTAPEPTPEPSPTPTYPDDAVVMESTLALWHCDAYATCADDGWGPWVGGAVGWPDWAAYPSNAREGSNSRTVRDLDGETLYPYMGSWADGCQLYVLEGEVLVIEWERGTDTWRPTRLSPGDVHTIDLVGSEDGAMIETPDTPTTFRVALAGCTPQPLP